MRKVIIGLLLIGLLVTPVNALVIRSGGERNLGGGSDGLIGLNDETSTALVTLGANVFYYMECEPDKTGKVSRAYMYHQFQANANVTFGIYETDGTILVYKHIYFGAEQGPEWQDFGLFDEIDLTNKKYIIGFVTTDTSYRSFSKSKIGTDRKSIPMTYSSTLSNADFSSATTIAANSAFCLYADNTAL